MLPKVNKKLFLINLVIVFGLIYGTVVLDVQQLQKEVAKRVNAQVVLGGTEGMELNIHTVGDKAPWTIGSQSGLTAINQALDVYPTAFLKTYGPNILLSNTLTLRGIPIGGTVVAQIPKGWVILESHYFFSTVESVRQAFHHEFSSILIEIAPFPHSEWNAVLPKDFNYPPRTNEAMHKSLLELRENRPSEDEMPAIYAQGFVTPYGMTNEENDINTYAEFLLDAPDELAKLAAQYPRIAKKAALLKDFYLSLDPGFKNSPFAKYDYASLAARKNGL